MEPSSGNKETRKGEGKWGKEPSIFDVCKIICLFVTSLPFHKIYFSCPQISVIFLTHPPRGRHIWMSPNGKAQSKDSGAPTERRNIPIILLPLLSARLSHPPPLRRASAVQIGYFDTAWGTAKPGWSGQPHFWAHDFGIPSNFR